jgi:hypothetical protein
MKKLLKSFVVRQSKNFFKAVLLDSAVALLSDDCHEELKSRTISRTSLLHGSQKAFVQKGTLSLF